MIENLTSMGVIGAVAAFAGVVVLMVTSRGNKKRARMTVTHHDYRPRTPGYTWRVGGKVVATGYILGNRYIVTMEASRTEFEASFLPTATREVVSRLGATILPGAMHPSQLARGKTTMLDVEMDRKVWRKHMDRLPAG